ncbi:MAG: hypothetical protein R2854_31590 [Caldilineaceae bacterium]
MGAPRVAFVKATTAPKACITPLALFAPPDVAENRCCSAQLQQRGPAAGIDPSCGVAHGDRAAQAGSAHSADTIADRSGMGNTAVVMRQLGVPELAAELGCDTGAGQCLPADEWVMVNAESHWSRGFPWRAAAWMPARSCNSAA